MTIRRLALALLAVVTLAGCAGSKSGAAYNREQARHEMTVRKGVVESLREVSMEGSRSGVGGFAGAAVGGVAGSSIGGGKGQIIGAIIGAVLGGMAGNALEEEGTKKQVLEITVRLENGQLIAVVQESAVNEFKPGDPVRVLSGGGESRVSR